MPKSEFMKWVKAEYAAGHITAAIAQGFGVNAHTLKLWDIPEPTAAQIVKQLLAGKTYPQIDAMFGMPARFTGNYLSEHPEIKAEVAAVLEQRTLRKWHRRLHPYFTGKKTQLALAKKYKVTNETICRWAKKIEQINEDFLNHF